MENFVTILVLAIFFLVLRMFRVIPMRALAVKERLGAFKGVLRPGFHFIVPFIDRIAYIHDGREQVIDIPKQRCITRDNVEVDVDGVVYLKVVDAQKASYGISNYTLQLSRSRKLRCAPKSARWRPTIHFANGTKSTTRS